jgi:hypothetical protein
MAYRLPTFNLACNIGPSANGAFTWPPAPYVGAPRLADVPCALVFGRRVNVASTGGTGDRGYPIQCMSLLLDTDTDVRSSQSVDGVPDVVEVPAGSGRWYGVFVVDDIGKGYANEHRHAGIIAIEGTWAVPYV